MNKYFSIIFVVIIGYLSVYGTETVSSWRALVLNEPIHSTSQLNPKEVKGPRGEIMNQEGARGEYLESSLGLVLIVLGIVVFGKFNESHASLTRKSISTND
jgi:hypothetical protein